MPLLTLNCPTCRRQLVNIPLDGLTLHYRCQEHGLLIFRPLMLVSGDEEITSPAPAVPPPSTTLHSHDAA